MSNTESQDTANESSRRASRASRRRRPALLAVAGLTLAAGLAFGIG